jgi:hypothetical protein
VEALRIFKTYFKLLLTRNAYEENQDPVVGVLYLKQFGASQQVRVCFVLT